MNIKTRFAPSPTGHLHIGNLRTALYSWLFARNQGGKFLLRIEDTNLKHSVNNDYTISNIISTMKWLNLDWDEGPYFQTDRFNRYNSIINYMIQHKMAYKCYCSPERLAWIRENQIKYKHKPKYDGYCRIELPTKITTQHAPYVVRFCNPITGKVTLYDKIRGIIIFDNQELDDLIIRRANGVPTYNFCVVVDDMDMKITHVIRGEEHINNTPRQINILKALNAPIPIYAHVPMILDKNKKKLSKRHGALGIIQYREDGFLPEAILNYLVRLGWSHGNQEIFSIEQMKQYFNFKNINKSSSVFNFEKLLWYNHYYIKNLPINYITSNLINYMNAKNINYTINKSKLSYIVKLFAQRSYTLQEIAHHYNCLFNDINIFETRLFRQHLSPSSIIPLKFFKNKLNNINTWTEDAIKAVMTETISKLNINMHTIGMPLRVALTGTDQSPSVCMIVYIIGKNRVINRINQAISYINQIF